MCQILVNININIHPNIDIWNVDIISGRYLHIICEENIRRQTTLQIASDIISEFSQFMALLAADARVHGGCVNVGRGRSGRWPRRPLGFLEAREDVADLDGTELEEHSELA